MNGVSGDIVREGRTKLIKMCGVASLLFFAVHFIVVVLGTGGYLVLTPAQVGWTGLVTLYTSVGFFMLTVVMFIFHKLEDW